MLSSLLQKQYKSLWLKPESFQLPGLNLSKTSGMVVCKTIPDSWARLRLWAVKSQLPRWPRDSEKQGWLVTELDLRYDNLLGKQVAAEDLPIFLLIFFAFEINSASLGLRASMSIITFPEKCKDQTRGCFDRALPILLTNWKRRLHIIILMTSH